MGSPLHFSHREAELAADSYRLYQAVDLQASLQNLALASSETLRQL